MNKEIDEKILKVFIPVTKYEKRGEEHWIQGMGSDTFLDRDEQKISKQLLTKFVEMIENTSQGLGCFPNHTFDINNLAAIHKKASLQKKNEDYQLIIESLLNPEHEQFEYYLWCFDNDAPFYYSIAVLNPTIESKNGYEIIQDGEPISIDLVSIPANPRTYVSLKGGGWITFENRTETLGKSQEEEKEMENQKIEQLQKTVQDQGKQLEKLTDTVEKLTEIIKEAEKEKETKEPEPGETSIEKGLTVVLAKLEDLDQRLTELGKESTGKHSGTGFSNMVEKEYENLTAKEKSKLWQNVVKG